MGWDHIIGQQRVKDLLMRALERKQVAHAYLFHGEPGTGKTALAIELARVLNCQVGGPTACGSCPSCRKVDTLQHPNIKLIVPLPVGKSEKTGDDPVGVLTQEQVTSLQHELASKAKDPYYEIRLAKANFIKVNSVRQIRREASMAGFESGKKVFIIANADQMNTEASNSLLKTLEEPPADTVLILTTARKEQLLPTIISRCQLVRCEPLTVQQIASALHERDGIDEGEAMIAAQLANGSFTAARELVSEDMAKRKAEVVRFLRTALSNSPVSLAAEIEGVLASTERADAERWLRLLQVWFHDALAMKTKHDRQSVHGGSDDDLQRFVERFGNGDLLGASEAVERSIALAGKNVYLPLIFTTLALDLKRLLSTQAHYQQ